MSDIGRIDWTRIEDFIGYGRRDARVVFIGMEEGLGANQNLEQDLARRSSYDPIMDLYKAHQGLSGTERFFSADLARVRSQRTWRAICHLLLCFTGNKNPGSDERKSYQAQRLGRIDGDVLMTELLPYPHNKNSAWDYTKFGRYESRQAYEEAILPRRRCLLRQLISEAPRDLIICYGKGYWPHYKDLFCGLKWQKKENCEIGWDGKTRIVLTPHFSSRQCNSNKHLVDLARVALED